MAYQAWAAFCSRNGPGLSTVKGLDERTCTSRLILPFPVGASAFLFSPARLRRRLPLPRLTARAPFACAGLKPYALLEAAIIGLLGASVHLGSPCPRSVAACFCYAHEALDDLPLRRMRRCFWVLVPPEPLQHAGRRVALRFSTAGFDLPDWFRNPKDVGPSSGVDGEEDDDFVLPAKPDFSEERSSDKGSGGSRPLSIRAGCPAAASHEDAEFEADVDEVSRVLSSRFASPEAIVIAMDCCPVSVSARLVDKILHRFGNNWVAAFGFFMWAGTQEGYCHCADSYDMMVDILGKFKQFDLMFGLISQMHEVGGLVSLTTMTKVMRRLCGASRWSDAIDVFHKMNRFGVAKDTKAMNVLLDTLCKERSVKRARGAFQELMGTIPPDESSFNTLVHGWCKAGMLKEARETMAEMEKHGFSPSVVTYTSLIEAYCTEKDFQTVQNILGEMRRKECSPNIITYTILMHALGKAGRTQEALDTFAKMKQDGCAPDASFYNSLIYILGRAGRLQDAIFVVKEMRRTGIPPNLTTFNTLISAACDHSQAENALKLLVKMEERSCKPDIKTYIPLLKLCCRRKWVKTVLFLICHMFRKDITPDFSTYTLLVSWLCRNGRIAQSCLFLEEMVMKGFTPKQETFDLVLGKLDKSNLHSAKRKVQLLRMQVASTRSTAPSYLGENGDARQNCAILPNISGTESNR